MELANIEKAHIKDGIAITKFMYWLKTNVAKTTITEISASNKLEEFRKQQEVFICGKASHQFALSKNMQP